MVTIEIFDGAATLGVLEVSDHADFPLALSLSLANIKDITKRSGVSSKVFRVPASKHNNQVLQYLYHIAVSAQAITNGVGAVIKVDGQKLFTGQLKISNLQQTLAPEYYELEFTADNLDWTSTLKELKLNQLPFNNPHIPGRYLSTGQWSNEQLPHGGGQVYLTQQTVEASWHGSVDAGWDYVYSLKNYGQWRYPYSHVTIAEMRPDIYCYAILQKAFAAAGYRLESSFLNAPFFKKLVIPFTGNYFRHSAAHQALYSRNLGFRQPINKLSERADWSTKVIDLSQLVQISGNSTLMQLYVDGTVLDTGLPFLNNIPIDCLGLKVSEKCSFDMAIGVPTWASHAGTVDVYLAERQATVAIADFKHLGYFDVALGHGFSVCEAAGITLAANTDYLLILVNTDIPTLNLLHNPPATETAYFKLERTLTIEEGNAFSLGSTLPEIPVLDVLTGLVNMFNLYIQTDNERRIVRMEPRKQFYKPIGDAMDWSGKLDVGQAIQTTYLDDYRRELQFVFKDDSADALIKAEREQNRVAPGSLSYTLPPRYNEGQQPLGNKTFAYTEMRSDPSAMPTGQAAAVYVPHFWGGNGTPPEPSYDFAPRLLYYQGLVSDAANGQPVQWGWYGKGNVLQAYPVATRHAPGHELEYGTATGFVAKYYYDDLLQISEGKLLTAHFNLSITEVRLLDLSKPIYLNHPQLAGYYWIQAVHDFVPTRRTTTKVELVPILFSGNVNLDYDQAVALQPRKVGVGIGAGVLPIDAAAGKVTHTDVLPGRPSVVLQNGSNNAAVRNSGSIAFGNGTVALGKQQHILGNYNVPNTDDVFQVGAGTSNTDRYRALTFTSDGNLLVQGGYIYTTDGREIMFASQRNPTGAPRRFDKVHLAGGG